MVDYEQLLKKYENYCPGERYTREYQRKLDIERSRKNKHLILDQLVNEIPFFLTKDEINRVRFFINIFPNFKTFHRRVSTECIILAFIFLMRTLRNPKTDVDKFRICKQYGLTNPVFRLILCRLNQQLMELKPLTAIEEEMCQ